MATESPIRISEVGDRWPAGKQSTAYRPSSAEMAMEGLGLFLKDQWFQNHEKDVIPSRCESAPPSMEGSTAAIGNISSHRRSATNPAMKYPNISAHNYDDPPSSSYDGTDVNPKQSFVEHSSSLKGYQPAGTAKMRNTADAKFANNPLQLPRNNLPAHEEESDDELFDQRAAGKAAHLGHHNCSLGSIQEDIYHAPSTSQDQSPSLGHKSSEKAVASDTESNVQHKNSSSISAADTDNTCLDDMRQAVSLDGQRDIMVSPPLHDQDINAAKGDAEDNHSTAGVGDASSIHIEAIKTANLLTALDLESQKLYKKDQLAPQNEVPQYQAIPQESNTSLVPGSYPHIIYPGIGHVYGSLNQFQYGSTSVSTAEIQPTLQSSGFTPPMYATQAVFMTSPSPYYPNLHPAGFYSPRYSVSGYNSNSTAPPSYLTGYPQEGAVPLVLNGAPLSPAGVPNGGSAHAYDLQNQQKYYGQIGLGMQVQPSYHIQYIQPPLRDPYAAYGNFVHQTPRYGAAVNQVGSRVPKKGAEHVGPSNDHKNHHFGATVYNNMNLKTMNAASHYYFGSSTNSGPPVQFPAASAVNPVTRAKPGPANNFLAGTYNISLPHSYSGSSSKANNQSQTWTDMNSYSLLEELKSGKGQRLELSDIAGHIVEVSVDQHGSRFIQQKLEMCSVEEKTSVFKEVVPHASKLITDVFGNYVIQKLFEYGNPEQRMYLATQLEGQILPLSLQMYGCRVIQKALDVIDLEQKVRLVRELDGHVLRCVRDQNGNHVIQKCIESIPADSINFIISSFHGQVTFLSTHPYGCRVIQRVLEHCNDETQTQFMVDEILESVLSLAQDQYGNYVTQHVLARWKPHERHEIIEKLSGSMVQLSQHKFASNVVEKCLQYSDPATKEKLIKEIIGHGEKNDNLLILMKDQYANYVIQKILDICSPDQREMLLGLVRDHLPALKKYTYGKHIAARFEQLYGDAIKQSGA